MKESFDRDDELGEFNRHHTPMSIAKYMMTHGKSVGKLYKTHGELWDVSDELLQTGLMQLAVKQLDVIIEKLHERPAACPLRQHAQFMKNDWPDIVKAVKENDRQRDRVTELVNGYRLSSSSLRDNWCFRDVHDASRIYRERGAWKDINLLRQRTKLLKRVKSIDDLGLLQGVGKVTVAKIRKHVEDQSR